jgi:hypothetical protein
MADSSDVAVQHAQVLLLSLISLASLVCFATAADVMSNPELSRLSAQSGWAVACGVISFVATLTFLALTRFLPELAQKVGPVVSAFLVLWWAFGVGLLTSSSANTASAVCDASQRSSIFSETNNGYFAVWIAFIASMYYMYMSVDQIQTTLEGRDFVNGLVTVSLASVIEFCAAANYPGHHAWAISCGIISFAVSFIQMILRSYAPEISRRSGPIVAVFLVLWWIFGVSFITSTRGPFFNTCCERANGYLSSWIAFLASLYYCYFTVYEYENPPPIVLGETQSLSSNAPVKSSGAVNPSGGSGGGEGYQIVTQE